MPIVPLQASAESIESLEEGISPHEVFNCEVSYSTLHRILEAHSGIPVGVLIWEENPSLAAFFNDEHPTSEGAEALEATYCNYYELLKAGAFVMDAVTPLQLAIYLERAEHFERLLPGFLSGFNKDHAYLVLTAAATTTTASSDADSFLSRLLKQELFQALDKEFQHRFSKRQVKDYTANQVDRTPQKLSMFGKSASTNPNPFDKDGLGRDKPSVF